MLTRGILFASLLFVLVACGRDIDETLAEYGISPTGEIEQTFSGETDESEPDGSDEPAPDESEPDEPALPFLAEDFAQTNLENLPEWLAVGLELYFLGADVADCGIEIARRMADEGYDFGDAWFIPGFVSGVTYEEAEAVALAFVQHISEAGALRDFVYAQGAEATAVYLWSDFTNGLESGGFGIRYERGRVRAVQGSPLSPFGIVLSVRGDYALYLFGHEADDTPEQWTLDTVNHYVAIGEESIRFVADWLGHELTRQFDVFFIHIDSHGGGGGYGEGVLTNFQHILDPPWAMAHEAVHALLSAAGIRNNFPTVRQRWGPDMYMIVPYFEEGLCIMLELLFEIETENERFALEAAGRRRGYNTAPGEFGNQETRLTLDDAIHYINNMAISFLDYYYVPGNTARFGTRYTVLNMHHTAASFMFYLYTERGTREDLLRAYRNINRMYEVYGADMDGMIQSWLAWLDGWR